MASEDIATRIRTKAIADFLDKNTDRDNKLVAPVILRTEGGNAVTIFQGETIVLDKCDNRILTVTTDDATILRIVDLERVEIAELM